MTRAIIDTALKAELRQTISGCRSVRDAEEPGERLSYGMADADPELRVVHSLPDRGPAVSNEQGFPPMRSFAVAPDIQRPRP